MYHSGVPVDANHCYTLGEVLYEGVEALLLRARRGDQPVLVKLAPPGWRRAHERLRHEFELGVAADPRAVLRPLALESLSGRPALVLEHFEGVPLSRLLGAPMGAEAFLARALALCEALARLHASQVTHKDLTPWNVLVEPRSGAVRLVGLGLATQLPVEHPLPAAAAEVEGTLPYLSPEQTGRMNRAIDSRTDLYSLGILFFQMLTATLPFEARDALEWFHCHLARVPPPPSSRAPGVPPCVDDIVARLLAKDPDERYRSALGLQADLRRAWEALRAGHPERRFPLGEQDLPEQLQLPQRLYGRQRELERLLRSFDEVLHTGRPQVVLLRGPPGIGKSRLVHELHKPVVRERCLFASGKFDALKRDIPYATLVQALSELVRHMLRSPEPELERWRAALRQALGECAGLMVQALPQLELVLGPQPPVPELPLAEAQHRLHRTFCRLVDVFAHPEHPLVLLLDDLQWADPASLLLLRHLLADPASRSLLLLGAYRDNEVEDSHPLSQLLEELRALGVPLCTLLLGPLPLQEVERFVADALGTGQAQPLARLAHEKTGGNPFFLGQFLTLLADAGLLTLDVEQRAWRWDLAGIQAQGFTENVLDLMERKLRRLPPATQQVLKLAACIGHRFSPSLLALASGAPQAELEQRLHEPLREGLVQHQGASYAFAHDRVRQAAYELMAPEQRADVHLQLGWLLLEQLSEAQLEEQLLEVVNHFHPAPARVHAPASRQRLARLFLRAGLKCKAAAAYASASSNLARGQELLGEGAWEQDGTLAHALHLERARCEFMSSRFEQAEQLLARVLEHARDAFEAADASIVLIELYSTLSQNEKAVDSGLRCLGPLGVELPARPGAERVRQEYRQVWELLEGRPIGSLVALPRLQARATETALRVLATLCAPSFFIDEHLNALLVCRMVRLSLEHGNAPASALGYVWFGALAGPTSGRYREGEAFGRLALALVERHRLLAWRAKVENIYATLVSFWTQPLEESLAHAQASRAAGLELGDLVFACFSSVNMVLCMLHLGRPLEEVMREAERQLDFVLRARYADVSSEIIAVQRLALALSGRTRQPGTFDDDSFSEEHFEQHLHAHRRAITICWYYVIKLQARYLAGDFGGAERAAAQAQSRVWTSRLHMQVPAWHHFAALTLAARWEHTPEAQRPERLEQLARHAEVLRIGAEHNPVDFLPRYAMVAAEQARLAGQPEQQERWLERAVSAAREHGRVQHEALAWELSARAWRQRGLASLAGACLREAHRCYLQWGAHARARQLEREQPWLRTPSAPMRGAQLDALAVARTSQALSSEILLERLLERLLRIVLEQAGAQRAVLLLYQQEQPQPVAEAWTDGQQVQVRARRPDEPSQLPYSLLHYVGRTCEPVLLEDAAEQGPFINDAYVSQVRPRSVLCLPVLRQARRVGLLYLENNALGGAFTPGQVSLLEVVAAQAAICLENATLYSALRASEERLATTLESIADAVITTDVQGHVVQLNPVAEQLTGWQRAQAAGRPLEEVFPVRHEGEQALAPVPLGLLRGDAPQRLERLELLGHGDARTPLAGTISLMRAEQGRPAGHVIVFRDVGEARWAERASQLLAEASHSLALSLELEATLQAIPPLVVPALAEAALLWVHEEPGTPPALRVATPSQPSWALLGQVAPRLVGPLALGSEPPPTARSQAPEALCEAQLDETWRASARDEQQLRALRALGVRAGVRLALGAHGAPLGVLCLLSTRAEGWSERELALLEELARRAALALEHAHLYRAAQQAIRLRDEFLSVASHELKTPLTGLRLQLLVLDRRVRQACGQQLPASSVQAMRVLHAQVDRLNRLVEELLDATRIRANKLPLKLEPVELGALVAELLEQVDADAHASSTPLELHCEGPVVGQFDRFRLSQVVLNLLSNALKYGAGRPVHVRVAREAEHALLSVKDEGIGIAEQDQQRIFEQFARAVPTRHFGGLGLGLYIARQVVLAHGGTLQVRSERGQGSTFTVKLPLGGQGGPDEPASDEPPP